MAYLRRLHFVLILEKALPFLGDELNVFRMVSRYNNRRACIASKSYKVQFVYTMGITTGYFFVARVPLITATDFGTRWDLDEVTDCAWGRWQRILKSGVCPTFYTWRFGLRSPRRPLSATQN